tara:strand:+ start:475 stop:1041 length:567 start_codon:yes stop_codon:yes gene_type:complete
MRIIAGKHKGTTLYLPVNKITRPLKDRVRESIFNLLTHSNQINFKFKNSNILDLYAGSGSFGLECLSRNAKKVSFVEKEKDAIEILKKNIKKIKVKNVDVFFDDIFSLVKKGNIFNSKFDLIFCDPPFKFLDLDILIQKISNNDLLQKKGILVLHRNKNTKEKLPLYFKTIDERIYGISKITFGKFLF